jgi:hypothetical protein
LKHYSIFLLIIVHKAGGGEGKHNPPRKGMPTLRRALVHVDVGKWAAETIRTIRKRLRVQPIQPHQITSLVNKEKSWNFVTGTPWFGWI